MVFAILKWLRTQTDIEIAYTAFIHPVHTYTQRVYVNVPIKGKI